MEQKESCRWKGKVKTTLAKANADQIWHLFKDYFNIAKWFPGLDTSRGIRGTNGTVGCIRYCAGTAFKPVGGHETVGWSNEILVAIDNVKRSFTYEILENNIGFNSYVATFKVVPKYKNGEGRGCVIKWSFGTDPVKGTSLKHMLVAYEISLHTMGKKMEHAVLKEHAEMND